MRIEKIIAFVFSAVLILGIIIFGAKFLINTINNKSFSSQQARAQEINKEYEAYVASQTDGNALTDNGTTFIRGNQLQAAIINLKRATVVDPNYYEAWFWLGYAFYKNNDITEAIEALNRAASIKPLDPRTYQVLSKAYQEKGDTEAANKALNNFEKFSNQ